MSSLQICLLSDVWFVDVFSPLWLSCHFSDGIVWCTEVVSFKSGYQSSLLLLVPLVSYLRSHCLPQGHRDVLLCFYLLLFHPKWLTHLFVKIDVWGCVGMWGCGGSRWSLCLCGANSSLTWRRPKLSLCFSCLRPTGMCVSVVSHDVSSVHQPQAARMRVYGCCCCCRWKVSSCGQKTEMSHMVSWPMIFTWVAGRLLPVVPSAWVEPLCRLFAWPVGRGAVLSPAWERSCRRQWSCPGVGSRGDGSNTYRSFFFTLFSPAPQTG